MYWGKTGSLLGQNLGNREMESIGPFSVSSRPSGHWFDFIAGSFLSVTQHLYLSIPLAAYVILRI